MIGTRPGSGRYHAGSALRVGHSLLLERPLVVAVNAGETRGLNLARHTAMNTAGAGTGTAAIHTPYGAAFDATTTGAEWFLAFDSGNAGASTLRFPTTRCTIAVLRKCADTTLRTGAICGFVSNTANLRLGMLIPDSGGIATLDWGGTTGNNRLTVSSISKTTDWETWVGVMGTRGLALFRNGIRLGAKTTAVTRTATSAEFRLNGGMSSANGNGDVQTIALFLLVEQEWTPTQVLEWHAAPFSIFEHPPLFRSVPVPVAAGGASNGGALYHHFRNLGVY